MSKSANQKLKLFYLTQILFEQTDDEHGLSVPELISLLAKYDISVDRKTLYSDFEELRRFGFDIIGEKSGKSYLYHVAERRFELAELKLLVDSVQAAKFITEKKSRELIKKLESLVSIYEAKELHRQVLISGRVKTMNESIYYNVDKLHTAINGNSQITFQYFQWNTDKKQELRHGGALYKVSPWALIWDDEYYYLVAYEAETDMVKHYRVDKMLHISVLEELRKGKDLFSGMDIAVYSNSLFGMFGGEVTEVCIEADNSFAGVFIDRFGKNIPIMRSDKNHFRTNVEVVAGPKFLSWIISLGTDVKIISPQNVVADMRKMLKEINRIYEV